MSKQNDSADIRLRLGVKERNALRELVTRFKIEASWFMEAPKNGVWRVTPDTAWDLHDEIEHHRRRMPCTTDEQFKERLAVTELLRRLENAINSA